MPPVRDDTVLLFYQDYERDRFFPGDRFLRRLVRPGFRALHRRQKVSGFLVWYRLLVRALREAGVDVRCNDRRAARRNPDHPVGLVGYPELLQGWDLPNPAVLGPGMYDHPRLAPNLMRDPRFHLYLVTCDWMGRVFARQYGEERCVPWHAGIDLAEWPDQRGEEKTVDLLVYDKIRWRRDELVPSLLDPILERLHERGMTTEVVRYRMYDHAGYRASLARARAMVFLVEHETQGLAYQEAMASGLPVLAWDPGYWKDPLRERLTEEPVPATSVPYFSPECGETFRDLAGFDAVVDRFLENLPHYTPREYVGRELSLAESAARYLGYYRSLLPAAIR